MATTAIDSLRGILNEFRNLNSKGIYSMNGTETDLLRQILLEVQGFDNLPNGIRINGVTHFYQSTPPTAEAIGDIWQKEAQDIAKWDGTHWLSPFKYLSASASSVATNSYFLPLSIPYLATSDTPATNIKIIYQRFFTSVAGATLDATNNWSIEPRYRTFSGGDVTLASSLLYNSTSQSGKYQLLLSNLVVPVTSISTVQVALTRNNAPSTGAFSHQLCYAHILG